MPILKRPPYRPRPPAKKITPRINRRSSGIGGATSTGGEVAPSTSPLTYTINNGTDFPGAQVDWQRQRIRMGLDGVAIYSNWAIHTWQLETMTMDDFETVRAQQGKVLTNLTSNDQASRNVARVYGKAILEGVVNGEQLGLIIQGVTLTFRVDTTS